MAMTKRQGYRERERESLIMAAQEQTIRTNVIKAKMEKTQAKSKRRLCGKMEERVRQIVWEGPMMTQREYKRWHDWVSRKIHWEYAEKLVWWKLK